MQRSPPDEGSRSGGRAGASAGAGADHRRGLGARGELIARRHLEARGLRIVDANFRTRHGELDIVALDARCLVFCEVKTRISRGRPGAGELGPFAAIGARKRLKVRLIAREWLAQRGADVPWRPELRFDAIGVELNREGRLERLDHLEGAF
jgi:putative endonuclease